ncbi:hypothetical protein FM107_07155 [Sphingobacterium sp. JB170]|nr:hypothetical protein FM107_07155 [Sphingobacterium sp. JB170]
MKTFFYRVKERFLHQNRTVYHRLIFDDAKIATMMKLQKHFEKKYSLFYHILDTQ